MDRDDLNKKSTRDYCFVCQFYETTNGVCTIIKENVKSYPAKFIKKCNGEYFERDPEKKIEEKHNESLDLQYDLNEQNYINNMKFIGFFDIFNGIISCFSIVGAILGIPLAIAGIKLNNASDSFKLYFETNDVKHLKNALYLQNKYFFINKILYIIGILFLCLSFSLVMIFAFLGLFNTK